MAVLDELEVSAMSLSLEERVLLADKLYCSVTQEDEGFDKKLIAECERRMEAVASGKMALLDGPQMIEELRQRFSRS